MKWRSLISIALTLIAFTVALTTVLQPSAQTDNTIYIRGFAGTTVGAKVAAAQATCGTNTQVPCILVIDPSMAAWANGTMPTLCSHCYLWDFRTGPPTGGAGSTVTVVPMSNPSARTGSQAPSDAIPSLTPWSDIRAYGATISPTSAIDSYVQLAVNAMHSKAGSTDGVYLPCVRLNNTGPGCLWNNPYALTPPPGGGEVRLYIEGGIQCGTTCTFPYWIHPIGLGGCFGNQFHATIPACLFGALVNGTLGTAISSAPSTAVTILPTFTNGTIANLAPGSAITIAAPSGATSTATAVRVAAVSPAGKGLVTLHLASAIRIPPGELFSVNFCADSSFNSVNNVVTTSDYSAQTITYIQTDATPASTTGCNVVGFNDDAFESARIQCSNGVPDTKDGFTCPSGNTVGANKITIAVNHNHSSNEQWGIVAAGPAFNTYNPQRWDNIYVYGSTGAALWLEGSTNAVLDKVGASAGAYPAAIAAELTGVYFSELKEVSFFSSGLGTQNVPPCPNGGCAQTSYPAALRCDSDVPGIFYSAATTCNAVVIDGRNFFLGGMKIDGQGGPIGGFPSISNLTEEEVWGGGLIVDNRGGIQAQSCLKLANWTLQDNLSSAFQPLIAFTDNKASSGGCVDIDNNDVVGTYVLTNSYFTGNLSVHGTPFGTEVAAPVNQSAPLGVYDEGSMLQGEIANEGASFAPQLLPYGSLSVITSPATWATLCAGGPGCSVVTSGVVAPDGPSGAMQAAELDGNTAGGSIVVGTYTGPTYPGDVILYGTWLRPIAGASFTVGYTGTNDAFNVASQGGDVFAPTNCGSSSCPANVAYPTAFGTQLSFNGWGVQVATAEITTGNPSSHAINMNLTAGAGGIADSGNQFAQPFMVFIPGPNNTVACAAAGTCNLRASQIEAARQDYYHGCVPPNATAGQLATCEGGAGGAPALGNTIDESGSWSAWPASGVYRFTGSSASTATLPSSLSTPPLIASVNNGGSANLTIASGGPTLVCLPSCTVAPGASAFLNTDGTDWFAMVSNVSAGSTVTYWTAPWTGSNTMYAGGTFANGISGWAFTPSVNVTFSAIYLAAQTADSSGLYSFAIANSSGALVCHPTTGFHIPATGSLITSSCSEGSVTLAAGSTYIFLSTSTVTVGQVSGTNNYSVIGPFYSGTVSGCSTSSGVISGTCSISLSEAPYINTPIFSLH